MNMTGINLCRVNYTNS